MQTFIKCLFFVLSDQTFIKREWMQGYPVFAFIFLSFDCGDAFISECVVCKIMFGIVQILDLCKY